MHAVGFPNCRTVASVVDLGEYPEPLESRLVEKKTPTVDTACDRIRAKTHGGKKKGACQTG